MSSLDFLYFKAIQAIGRTLAWKENLKNTSDYDARNKPLTMEQVDRKWDPAHFIAGPGRTPKPDANLISSLCDDGMHAPAIDIDLPVHLVPSSTPGQYHLYFDKKMPWADYQKLLKVMTEVGLVEQGYYEASVAHKQSYLRLPHIKKEA